MDVRKHSGTTDPSVSERERRSRDLSRRAAAEGMVLLKNDGLLPLKRDAGIALLGGGAARTVQGGTGSGGVNVRDSVSIRDGLENAGFSITSGDWLRDFDIRYQAARRLWRETILEDTRKVSNPFDAYAAHPFRMPEGREITAEDVAAADAAVYVVSRIAGEGRDRRLEKGDYYLSDAEERDLEYLDQSGIPVVLVMNSGGPVELTDALKNQNIHAALYISHPGQEGGNAVADVLSGNVTPSGKLACTWARRYADYPPCAKDFGYLNGDLSKDRYEDGIYVGYRWFEASAAAPLFPFGYGLSYTSFSMECVGITAEPNAVTVRVRVQNTGTRYTGKEVVQLYVSCPWTQRGQRERKRLAGFRKTTALAPNEAQILDVVAEPMDLAGFSEERHAWMLEQGVYGIWVGNSVSSASLRGFLRLEQDTVLKTVSPICPLWEALKQTDTPDSADCDEERPEAYPDLSVTVWNPIPEPESCAEPISKEADSLAVSLPPGELIPLLCGNIVEGGSAFGSAGVRVPGSAGETTQALENHYGVPSLVMADGPAGVRLKNHYQVNRKTDAVYPIPLLGFFEGGVLIEEDTHEDAETWYQYCTAFPVGTLLAQTWDTDLIHRVGAAVAEELEEFGVQLWLAPGMNIQRNPLCGRNFEYYSEDPLLSGSIAAAMVSGVQESGRAGAVIKHFACNNQEDNRMGVDAVISERALREIYLRGFAAAIRKAQPLALMTSYNLINGVHTANSSDLCTVYVRRECGFRGLIMTDWTTTSPDGGSIPWKCAEAGSDLIMPGSAADIADIQSALADGRLSEKRIRESAERVLRAIRLLDG